MMSSDHLTNAQRSNIAGVYGTRFVEALVEWVLAAGFNRTRYLSDHRDLQLAGLDCNGALYHFLVAGIFEQRKLDFLPLPAGLDTFERVKIENTRHRNALLRSIYSAQSLDGKSLSYFWSGLNKNFNDFICSSHANAYVVIGDSHSRLYDRSPVERWWVPIMLLCSGGSAAGLNNDHSRSGYGANVMRWAQANRSAPNQDLPIFLKFGQVDAEFVYIFNRLREQARTASIDHFLDFAESTVLKYQEFLARLKNLVNPARLKVCSIFPPALGDSTWAEGYVNAHIGFLEGDREISELAAGIRDLEIPDLAARTRMHEMFNDILRAACSKLDLCFVDDFSPLLAANGIVDPRHFEKACGKDHHLDYHTTEDVIVELISRHTA